MLGSGNTDPVHQDKAWISGNSDYSVNELSDGVEMLQAFERIHIWQLMMQYNDL